MVLVRDGEERNCERGLKDDNRKEEGNFGVLNIRRGGKYYFCCGRKENTIRLYKGKKIKLGLKTQGERVAQINVTVGQERK